MNWHVWAEELDVEIRYTLVRSNLSLVVYETRDGRFGMVMQAADDRLHTTPLLPYETVIIGSIAP